MKIVFFGTPHFVISVLEALNSHFEVVAIVTSPDKKVGRQQKLTPSAIKKFALEHQLPAKILTPDKLNEKTISILQAQNPDLFIVAAYGKIIPQEVLDIPRFGTLNIHPSLLPKYRGTSPIQAAILNGDQETGVTIMQIDAKMDHGPLLHQEVIPLKPTDTLENLHNELFQKGADLLISLIPQYIEGKLKLIPQDHTKATFTKMIKKEAGFFEAGGPPAPEVLEKMIRAYYPWPGVWTRWEGKIIKFLPGGLVQMEGKKPTPLKSFLNGHPTFPIKQLLNS